MHNITKLCFVFLSCALVFACADDKRTAPKQGRLSLSPDIVFAPTKNAVKLDSDHNPETWTMTYQNTQNDLPHTESYHLNTPVWTTDIGKSYTEADFPETPVIAMQQNLYAIDGDFTLSKVNPQDGHILWQKKLMDSQVPAVGLSASENNIFAISQQGHVFAIDKDGNILWQKELNIPVRTTPTLNKNILFIVSSKNLVLALNQKTGKEIWRYQTTEDSTLLRGMAHPALDKETLIVPFTNGEVIAFDAASGMIEWGQTMIGKQLTDLHELPHILASPVIHKGVVYLAGNANLIGAYNMRTGDTKWTQNIGVLQTPVISGNALFIITKNRHLMAIQIQDGRIFWDKQMPGEKDTIWRNLRLNGKNLLIENQNILYIINPLSGEIISTQKPSEFITTPVVLKNSMVGVTKRAKLKLYQQGNE